MAKLDKRSSPSLQSFSFATKVSGGFLVVILLLLLFQLYVGQKPAEQTLASIQTTPKSENEVVICEKNQDCILVKKDCCACDVGGDKTAINRKYYSHWLSKKQDQCIFASCSNVQSNDFSCNPQSMAVCVNNKCQIK